MRCGLSNPWNRIIRKTVRVALALPDHVDNAALAAKLQAKHGVVVKVVPRNLVNGLRVSSHVYNLEQDADRLLGALKKELG